MGRIIADVVVGGGDEGGSVVPLDTRVMIKLHFDSHYWKPILCNGNSSSKLDIILLEINGGIMLEYAKRYSSIIMFSEAQIRNPALVVVPSGS